MNNSNMLADQMRAFLAPESVLEDQASLEFYGRDWIKDFKPAPCLVVLPNNSE